MDLNTARECFKLYINNINDIESLPSHQEIDTADIYGLKSLLELTHMKYLISSSYISSRMSNAYQHLLNIISSRIKLHQSSVTQELIKDNKILKEKINKLKNQLNTSKDNTKQDSKEIKEEAKSWSLF